MLDCYQSLAREVFPSNPRKQHAAAAAAVFRSWDGSKATTYRRLNRISDDAGTEKISWPGRQRLSDNDRLRIALPGIWAQLGEFAHPLEGLAGDAQDFEFTVQSGVLYPLQTRRAKRTDWTALTIASDMVEEGLLTPAKGLALLDGVKLDAVVRTSFARAASQSLAA
jgi:pyruvate,orthophosphate dikinase